MLLKGCNFGNWFMIEPWMLGGTIDVPSDSPPPDDAPPGKARTLGKSRVEGFSRWRAR